MDIINTTLEPKGPSSIVTFALKAKLTGEEQSVITNCIFIKKEGEDNDLFTFYESEFCIVKLDGYALIPIKIYKKLNRLPNLIKSVKNIFHKRINYLIKAVRKLC